MSDPDAPPLDEEVIVRALDANGVEYVLVGGLGARARGATKPTQDFDFCPAATLDNLDRVAAALRSLDALLRVEGLPEGLAVPIDGRFLSNLELSTWRTRAGDIDVLKGIPAGTMSQLNRYPDLLPRADIAEFVGYRLYVASLDDIILSKETANRPADREALPELRALRAAELAGAAYPEAPGSSRGRTSGGSPAEPQSRSPGPEDDRDPPGRSLH